MKRIILLLIASAAALVSAAQTEWYDPTAAGFPAVQSQAWPGELRANPYQRFPDRAEGSVRDVVWRLSRNSAGESLEFTTNASEITVRYTLASQRISMAHMPSTGVSGVDLYTRDRNGDEIWIGGKYSFKDTVTYTFAKLDFDRNTRKAHTYTLFLPLYNTVTWLEIGVNEGASFRFEPQRAEAPIVAYGTSICHGACASRPGMAWTNILQRRMDRPVLNFGFSGNAFFEKEVTDMLGEIEAAVYILDALPNSHTLGHEELRDTIVSAVRRLRAVRPDTPILLADHLGYPHGRAIEYWRVQEAHANNTQKEAFDLLKSQGVKNIYHLTYDEIGLPQDATVEGIHASDWGMKVYADAYEAKLRVIMNEPAGDYPTMRPVRQARDFYDWNVRHRDILLSTRGNHYNTVIIGNSIVHQWGGIPDFSVKSGAKAWDKHLAGALNLGCGWDCVENVLWRIYHDELDNLTADRIVLMIGTNDIATGDTDEAIVAGIEHLLRAISARRPEARLKLIGILPRRDLEERVAGINGMLRTMAAGLGVEFADPGRRLLGKDGKIVEKYFRDGLHPANEGYERIVSEFEK